MMLPEHVAELLRQAKERNKKERPELDAQYVEELNRKMRAAYLSRAKVGLKLFGEWQDRYLTGYITHLDPGRGRVRIATEGRGLWVKFADVLDVDGEV